MKCIDSRPSPEGRRRRYKDGIGQITETIEVPLPLWRWLNRQGRSRDRVAAYNRKLTRQELKTRAVVLVHLHGVKPLAVAHELGVPVRTVQRWAQQ